MLEVVLRFRSLISMSMVSQLQSSDHKPLAAISNKPLRSAPEATRDAVEAAEVLQNYVIVYKPGPEVHLTDTLSRAFLPTTKNIQGDFGWEIGGDEKQHLWWWSATSVKRRDPDQLARDEGEPPSNTSFVLQFQRWDECLWLSCFQRRMTTYPEADAVNNGEMPA